MTKSRTARSAFGARVVTAAAWGLLGCGSPAPQGEALAVPVLVFHGICAGECAADDVYSVSASELRQILADADALGFESISIDTYNRIMRGDVEGAPMHPILLTFDDGRHDAYVNADPILEAAHARATMFVIANAPASGFAFYMTWDELRAARASGRWDIEQGLMAKSSINDTCAQCHQDIRLQFNRRSHMPLPEGAMSCDDCHNPHGSLTNPLLKTSTVNETCYQCHAEKRGPFLFEHAPVRENCLNCHTPHGSNQSTLLVAPVPFLCQQCHTNFLHPNDLQTKQALGTGLHPDERVQGRGCLTCHANIHGSNAPSGVRFHE